MIQTLGRLGTACLLLLATLAAPAADFTIRNLDADSNSGLADTSPRDPVGGNTGRTLGQQRRIALRYGIRIVASRIGSPVAIRIDASVDPDRDDLVCQRNRATLGLGGATNYTAGFPGAPVDDVVYPLALANALAGRRLADGADLRLFLNGKLDEPANDCLRGARWYYGLDGNTGANEIDFVGTVVHELIHGLGFQSIVSLVDSADAPIGAFPVFRNGQRFPDVFSTLIQDVGFTGQPLWPALRTRARRESATNAPFVVWSSAMTNNATTNYITAGRQDGRIRLYAPSTLQPASSISHWSPAVTPNQIMEPFESVEDGVGNGLGLAVCVLRDIGWTLSDGVRCPDTNSPTIAGDSEGTFVERFAPVASQARVDSGDGADDNGGGSGGGCTLAPGQPFDPVWWAMCVLAVGVLVRRRRLALG